MGILDYLFMGVVIAFCIYGMVMMIRFDDNMEHPAEKFGFTPDLAKRFVSDYNFPVSMVNNYRLFRYQLELYEPELKTMTRWKELQQMIKERFGGDTDAFVEYYNKVRNDIITKTYESAAYQEFNNMDMQQFAVKDRPQVSKNNVYNNENDGKMFLSIDLCRANFQALKYVNRKIFNGAQTYEDYVGQFTDLDYLKTSKYTRQVIFGQLNPARHTTVEQYLINKVYKAVLELDYLPFNASTGLVSMSNDELVFCIDQLYDPKNYSECIVQDIKTKTGLTVHVDAYELHGYSLVSESECTHKEFFVKKDLETGREEFTCMPLQFHMMGWRLFRKQPLHPEDKLFIYENGICRFCEDYKLITIKEAEEKFGKPGDKKKDKNQYKKSKKNEQA
jgi:hypothetical protein